MKILVTGGAGFIGSHLVDSLIEKKHQLLVVDDLSAGKKEYVNSKAKFIELDIRDEKLSKVIADFKPEVVYHLAAQKNVRTSLENPVLDASINILGSLNLLNNSIKNKVKKFIFPSTCGIYGDTDLLPTPETGQEQPLSPYILNKLTLEKYLQILTKDKIKWSALRLANVYGPRQDPYGEAGVVSIFLDNAIQGKESKITGDGKQTRDFIYVSDVVDAFLASLDDAEGIYNIGTGKESSLLELMEVIKELVDSEIKYKHIDEIKGEVKRSSVDCAKAKKYFDWQAQYDLKHGLELTYAWFKDNKNE